MTAPRMRSGQRRGRLVAAIELMVNQDFAGRVLQFDSKAARSYSSIAAERRAAGIPIMESAAKRVGIAGLGTLG
jgi:toxin FitB